MPKQLYTLLLDRDGVINVRTPGDYIKTIPEYIFEKRALEALALLGALFSRIVVVTNQAGVGKGKMSAHDLDLVHAYMLEKIRENGGKIDKVYHCPHPPSDRCNCRKPAPGMALAAKRDFPDMNFEQSIMVGDSLSDIQFGQQLGMRTVWIEGKAEDHHLIEAIHPDFRFKSLYDFAEFCEKTLVI